MLLCHLGDGVDDLGQGPLEVAESWSPAANEVLVTLTTAMGGAASYRATARPARACGSR
jgi:hypothetical protein